MKNIYIVIFSFLILQSNLCAQDTKIGRHTVSEWHHLIDTTWGEGRTTTEKLQIFDLFWNAIDQRYAAFEGIEDNWQQLKSYRDTIALGVCRGRFSGILTHLVRSLHDGHVYMFDSIFNSTPLQKDVPVLVPVAINYPSFNWNTSDRFGAALTPLPDSTLLVYAAVQNHPLGLVPGDRVLGYDGILWKDLYKALWEIQFPSQLFFVINCSKRAATHEWLGTAGLNWHLFDTIDVVKHATGDTIHLPTDLLSTPMPGIHATEQMPIAGVPFPDVENGHHVSWGYIEGTKIGYIYVYGWHFLNSIDEDFLSAVNTFLPTDSSDGLIIDLRTNEGSDIARWTKGFRRLFNQDFEAIKHLKRANPNNHLEMIPSPEWDFQGNLVGSDDQLYDRPIAVLCGPWTHSGGDISAQILRQHPMVHTFGKPTPGAFGPTVLDDIQGLPGEWSTGITVAVGYTPPDWNNRLYRRSIPVDEEVWLTPEGVAKGEDAVVIKALDWINNLVYGHALTKNMSYCRPGVDTLKISVLLQNPHSHQTSSKVYIKNLDGNLFDSLDLIKGGVSGNSEIWSANYLVQPSEDFFSISLSANDITESKTWKTDNISRFTTVGPLSIDSIAHVKTSGNEFSLKPYVTNHSSTGTITGAKARISCNDPWVLVSKPENILPNVSPGASVRCLSWNTIKCIDSLFPGYFTIKVEILVDGHSYWSDSVRIDVGLSRVKDNTMPPFAYELAQCYPNPFNPSTTISWQIAKGGKVFLSVYDLLGRDVATLVDKYKPAGKYETEFDATSLPSGVYFYRLNAGSYTATKKMIFMK